MSMTHFDYMKALFLLNRIKSQTEVLAEERVDDLERNIETLGILEFPDEYYDSLIGDYIDDLDNLTLLLASWVFFAKAAEGKGYAWADKLAVLRIRENNCVLELPTLIDDRGENQVIVVPDWREAINKFTEFMEKVHPEQLSHLIMQHP